eukprot:gb/GECG01012269.1/.p1 GENE.gb/GECG01012269.1/~~gb/GECG01012269.1/.p1  ORF type:complete len:343 (+),score=45.80 gb/GECG01012269.1/:1-1029(+)
MASQLRGAWRVWWKPPVAAARKAVLTRRFLSSSSYTEGSGYSRPDKPSHTLPIVTSDGRLDTSDLTTFQAPYPAMDGNYSPGAYNDTSTRRRRGRAKSPWYLAKVTLLLAVLGGCAVTGFQILKVWVKRMLQTQQVCQQVAYKAARSSLHELQKLDQYIVAYVSGMQGRDGEHLKNQNQNVPPPQEVIAKQSSNEVCTLYDEHDRELILDMRMESLLNINRERLPQDPAIEQLLRARDLRVSEIREGCLLQEDLRNNRPDETQIWVDPREWKKVQDNAKKTRDVAKKIEQAEKERKRRMTNVASTLGVKPEWDQPTSQALRDHLKKLDYPFEKHAKRKRQQR